MRVLLGRQSRPGAWQDVAVLVLACVAVAVAIWLTTASVHIVGWRGRTATRVALFAPPQLLWWALGLTLAAMATLAVWWVRLSHRPLSALAVMLAPLTLLFVWAVPYLPWLPGRFPILMVLAGPLRWFVAALAAGGCAWYALSLAGIRSPAVTLPGRRTVFVVSLIVFLTLGFHVRRVQVLGGDEPHYLVIAHSLMVDGDLQIENNHAERQYAAFYGGDLRPHYLHRGLEGVMYSVHAPGLPVLLLPAYAVGGYVGALAVMGLLAALAALALFDLARELASPRVALVTWAAVAFTIPFGLHSWMIFPEMAAALVMALSALWLWKPVPDRAWPWLWRGAAIATLPWLHTKFSVLLGAMTLCLIVRLWPRVVATLALVVPIVISCLLWLYSFYVMYGVPDPAIAYGFTDQDGLTAANVPRGVLGLLFDQEYGLLLHSPVYLLAAAGVWVMVRRPALRWYAIGLAATATAFVIGATQFYMWWGGDSVPARFLVPVLPLLAPIIAVGVHEMRGAGVRGLIGLVVGLSLACFAAVVAVPSRWLMFDDRDGSGRLIEAIQARAPLTAALPSFINPDWLSPLLSVAVWVAAGMLALFITRFALRRIRLGPRPFWAAALWLILFALTGSGLATTLPLAGRMAVANEGQLSLLAAYDGTRRQVFDYETFEPLDADGLFRRAVVRQRYVGGAGANSVSRRGPR